MFTSDLNTCTPSVYTCANYMYSLFTSDLNTCTPSVYTCANYVYSLFTYDLNTCTPSVYTKASSGYSPCLHLTLLGVLTLYYLVGVLRLCSPREVYTLCVLPI